MCRNIWTIAILLGVANLIDSKLAPFITPCKWSDSVCASKNAVDALPIFAAGIPDLGLESLKSIYFDKVDASSPNLKFIMKDVVLEGLENCQALGVDTSNPIKIKLNLLCSVQGVGQYELTGKILVLTLEGKGKIEVILRKAAIDLELDIVTKKGKDGKDHWHVKRFTHKVDLKDKSDIIFENLFEGDDALSKAGSELIKSNSNDIIQEIGSPMIVTAITRVIKNFNQFFAAVPIDELVIE